MITRSEPWHRPAAGALRRRRGLTLIEAAMVLAVVTLVFAGFAQLLNDASENMKLKTAVDRLKEVSKAAEMYVSANAKVIREQVNDSWVAIPVTGTGVAYGMASVQAAGFLPSTYKDTNSYRQGHTLYIKTLPNADPANTSRQARRIEAIVTTEALGAANNRIPWRMLGKAGQMMGSQGGFCRGSTPDDNTCTYVTGAAGGWRIAASEIHARPGSIQSALFVSDNGMVTDYLNRNDIGNPEANTMRATVISSPENGYAMVAGTDAAGNQITELKFGPNIKVDGYVKAGSYVQAGECSQAGNPGFVYACQNVEAGIDVNAGRNVNAGDTFYGQKFVDTNDTSRMVDPSGRSNLKQLNITDLVVNTDDDGDRLKGNQSVRLRDLLPRYVQKDGFEVSEANPDVALPVCPNGGQQRIFLTPMQDSFSYDLAKYIAPQISDKYVYEPQYGEALTSINCGNSACVGDRDWFIKGNGTAQRQAVTALGFGHLKHFRQYVADPPSLGTGNIWYWKVRLLSPATTGGDADPEPLPWKALAMTYCYY